MATPDDQPPSGGVLLSLRFQPIEHPEPHPEDVASVLRDIEGLYRAVPAASALGVPVRELLAEYQLARAQAEAARITGIFPLRRWLPVDEMEEYLYWSRRYRSNEFEMRRTRLEPEHPIRLRRLSMASPLDVLAYIPAAYCVGASLLKFLKALETYFNMPERIRTERIDLKAKQAERRADEREAELREAHAARELEGLERARAPFELIDGEVLPDESEDAQG